MVFDNLGIGGYKPSSLKSNLKMAVTRLAISSNKKSVLAKQQIREIATMLADTPPREEKARIRAESLIRDDNTIEAYELLSLHCELVCERIHLISHSKKCPPDLLSCVCTLIWASCVIDVPELQTIRTQFRYKFGKEFERNAMLNVNGVVNARVAMKLSVQPPPAYEVQLYLEKIAEEQEVNWKPKASVKGNGIVEPMGAPSGYSVPTRGGSGLFPSNNYNVEELSAMGDSRMGGGSGGRRVADDDNDDDDDWDNGGDYGGSGGAGGSMIGPSAPPLSPMTVNTTLPEVPKHTVNGNYTTKQGINSWTTTNTVTTMASTTNTAASATNSSGRLPSAYVPVLPVPTRRSSHVHSSKIDATTEKEDENYGSNAGGNYGGDDDARDGDKHAMPGGDGAIPKDKLLKEEEKEPVSSRGEQLKSTHSGLIVEATRMANDYDELIAKFEKLNRNK